jgi:hypothetical protein
MPVAMVMFFPPSNGLNGQMQSDLYRVQVVMVEHTPIGISHLNLVLGSILIKEGLPQPERLLKLNQIAISQMTVLESIGENKLLK